MTTKAIWCWEGHPGTEKGHQVKTKETGNVSY